MLPNLARNTSPPTTHPSPGDHNYTRVRAIEQEQRGRDVILRESSYRRPVVNGPEQGCQYRDSVVRSGQFYCPLATHFCFQRQKKKLLSLFCYFLSHNLPDHSYLEIFQLLLGVYLLSSDIYIRGVAITGPEQPSMARADKASCVPIFVSSLVFGYD